MTEPKKRYIFEVPNTKLSYAIQIVYEEGLLRQLELASLYRNGRDVTMSHLTEQEKQLFLEHFTKKINNAPITL